MRSGRDKGRNDNCYKFRQRARENFAAYDLDPDHSGGTDLFQRLGCVWSDKLVAQGKSRSLRHI